MAVELLDRLQTRDKPAGKTRVYTAGLCSPRSIMRIAVSYVIRASAFTNGSYFSGDAPLRKPMTGIRACCARAASGHATAAPPSSVMKSRRLNWSNCIRSPAGQGRIAGYRIGEEQSGGNGDQSKAPPADRVSRRVGWEMSVVGTELPIPNVRSSVVIGGKADKVCSMRVLCVLTRSCHSGCLAECRRGVVSRRPCVPAHCPRQAQQTACEQATRSGALRRSS
jgi:hypothetical protein